MANKIVAKMSVKESMSAGMSDKSGISAQMSRGGGGSGHDGFSPIANVNKVGDTATITITDKIGTTTAQISDGQDGQDGQDGYSPTIETEPSAGGTDIIITDINGTNTITIYDGEPGQDGQDGTNGFSPIITVTDITGGHQVEIEDAYGTNTFDVIDGQDGTNGSPGVYVGSTAPVDPYAQVWIDTSGDGDVVTVTGANPVINGVANTTYICGEVSTITINPPASGIIDVIFSSGSTVAVLTLPQTVKMPNDFEVETNRTYEINIFNNLGAVMSWT